MFKQQTIDDVKGKHVIRFHFEVTLCSNFQQICRSVKRSLLWPGA